MWASCSTRTALAAPSSEVQIPDPKPSTLVRLHFAAMVFWGLNLPLLALVGVRTSVPYIAFCSVYANFVGHFSGWDAARAEVSADDRS